jgi:hypothetical protein
MQTGQATVIEPITASTEIGRIACIPCSGLPVRDFVRELAYRQVSAGGCGRAKKRQRLVQQGEGNWA